jgi:hypothetical protein
MNKNENMKIFNNNLLAVRGTNVLARYKNPKSVLLRSKLNLVGKTRYLPSFSKE